MNQTFLDKLKASPLWTKTIAGVPILFFILGAVVFLFIFVHRKMKKKMQRLRILRRARAAKKRKRRR